MIPAPVTLTYGSTGCWIPACDPSVLDPRVKAASDRRGVTLDRPATVFDGVDLVKGTGICGRSCC